MDKLVYPELSYELNGYLFQVHNELGPYCREKQYCDALENLLKKNGKVYERELFIGNKSDLVERNTNRIDFLIENKIIIEVKAKRIVGREEYHQIQRYLSATGLKLGMLVNFNQKFLTPRRILNPNGKE